MIRAALLLTCLAAASPARATEVDLVAQAFDRIMPDGQPVRMWGFYEGTSDCTTPGAPTVPGPTVSTVTGSGPLVVRLRNCLAVPVSLVVPALPVALAPEAGAGGRITSFTTTTAPGALGVYTFDALRPGTFLYHSGTQPQVQVPMGLYGAIVVETAAGEAYPGVTPDRDAVLLFSEVDPALNAAVAAGTFGTSVYPSTIRYSPRWFLINGEAAPSIPALGPATAGEQVLLRLLNVGLETHVAEVVGLYMTHLAEDGLPYAHPRTEWSALLPPGKTVDALVAPSSAGIYGLYDRMLSVSNPVTGAGGMLTRLVVDPVAGAPVAAGDAYDVDEDGTLAVPAPGVLANDGGAGLAAELVQGPANGALALAADGSFTYAPAPDFAGDDTFTYRPTSGGVPGNTATVAIRVIPANDPPVAVADAASVQGGSSVMVMVLANDHDPDGDALSVVSFTQGAGGAVSSTGDHVVYTAAAGFSGVDSFTYVAGDPSGATSSATVTVTVAPRVNQPPVAADDFAATPLNTPITISVVANDVDPDGAIDPTTVAIVTPPTRRGIVVNNANGTVTYRPARNFRGTDVFTYQVRDDEGAASNVATVRVNVQ